MKIMLIKKIIKKLYFATKCSLAGFYYGYKHEFAFRLELYIALILTPLAIYIAKDLNQFLWLFFSYHLVLVAELINTAIEATVDRVGKKDHVLSKHAKDVASSVVFYTIIMAVVVWAVIVYEFYTMHYC